MWNKVVVAYIRLLSPNLPGGIEEINVKPRSG
jgi:hypothetical protein